MRILRKGAGDQVAGKDNQWWQTDRREETTSRSSSTDDGYNTSPDDTPYIGPNQDGGDGDDSSDSSKKPPKKDRDQDDRDNEKDNNDDNDNNEQNEDNNGDDTGNPNDDYDTDPDSDNDSPYDTTPDDDTDESDDSGDSDSTEDSSGNEGDDSGAVAAGDDGEGDNSTGEDDPGELGAEGTDAYTDDGAQTPPPRGYDSEDGPDVNAAMDGEAPEGEMGEDGLDGYNDDATDDNDSEEGESPSVDEAMDNESPEEEMGEDGTDSYDDEGNEGNEGDGDDEGDSEDSSGSDSDSDSSEDTGSEVGGAGLSGESGDSDSPTAGARSAPGAGMDTEELAEGMDTDQLESPDEGLDGISADTGGSSEVGETVGDDAGGVSGEDMAVLDFAQDLDGAVDEDGDVDDEAVSEASKKFAKSYIKSIIIANIGPILLVIFIIAMVVGAMGTFLTLNSANVVLMEEEGEGGSGGSGGKGAGDLDYSNHNISDAALEWKDEVEEALSKTGLGEEWVYIVLAMIHQESGGNAEASPDSMQSSESKGWEPNTITDPIVSIEAGVEALEKAVNAAEAQGISDLRAILQGYNMGHKFLTIMSEEGQTHWTSDYAEQYSINVVFPAVTKRPASEATKADSYSAWSVKIGKPYYIKNGGDFHYPNAILHALGIDYTGDGPIDIADVQPALLTEGSLSGYQFPMPIAEMQITSDFGMRLHPNSGVWKPHNGIDAQYKGALFHAEGPIYAAADGKVTFAGDLGSAGNSVIIEHGPPGENDVGLNPDYPITTKYFHLALPSSLRVGQEVRAGEYIGKEGKTGVVTGEHLHYELHSADGPFNPRLIYELPPSLY